MTANLQTALKAIDKANSEDPNNELIHGESVPKELVYGQRMSARLNRFAPNSAIALQLAVRSQHIQRWVIPRSDYPEGRIGYKKWRTEQAKFHAKTTAGILLKIGFEQEIIHRVEDLLKKKALKRDIEVQTLEDVACLVFFEYYLEPFSEKHSDDKIISIIQKTWKKMSEKGQKTALKLPLSRDMLDLVQKALM